MVPWVLTEGFGVPYPQERSGKHKQGRREGERERGRWRSLDQRFLIARYSRSDPVNSRRVVQDTELRLHYGRSLTSAWFLQRIGLAGLLQDTTLSQGAVSHGHPGPGPDIFHIHPQVCVSVLNGPGCLCIVCDPLNDLCNIIKNGPAVKL